MNQEEFRDIPGYKGFYQASNLGNIRSLDRVLTYTDGRKHKYTGSEMKQTINNVGYKVVRLSKLSKTRLFLVHQLIAMAFLNHTINRNKIIIDHINNDRLNNHVSNLQITSQRINTVKDTDRGECKSVGVTITPSGAYHARIYKNNKTYYLGTFKTEEEASSAYQNKLHEN